EAKAALLRLEPFDDGEIGPAGVQPLLHAGLIFFGVIDPLRLGEAVELDDDGARPHRAFDHALRAPRDQEPAAIRRKERPHEVLIAPVRLGVVDVEMDDPVSLRHVAPRHPSAPTRCEGARLTIHQNTTAATAIPASDNTTPCPVA